MSSRTYAFALTISALALLLMPGAVADESSCNLVKFNQTITLDYFIGAEVGFQTFDNCEYIGEWVYTSDNGDDTYDYQFNGVWFVLEV